MSLDSNRDKHYDHMPMQYTANFNGACKDDNFQLKFFGYFFFYFCSKHRLWVHIRSALMRRF